MVPTTGRLAFMFIAGLILLFISITVGVKTRDAYQYAKYNYAGWGSVAFRGTLCVAAAVSGILLILRVPTIFY